MRLELFNNLIACRVVVVVVVVVVIVVEEYPVMRLRLFRKA
jgi:hypothetical protein